MVGKAMQMARSPDRAPEPFYALFPSDCLIKKDLKGTCFRWDKPGGRASARGVILGLIGCHARQRIARECRIQSCVLSVLLIGRQRPEPSCRMFGLRSFCSVSVLRGTYLNQGAPGAHLQISSRKEETCAAFYKTHSGTASAARAGAAPALRLALRGAFRAFSGM